MCSSPVLVNSPLGWEDLRKENSMLTGCWSQIRGVLPNTSEPYGGCWGPRDGTWALSLAMEEGCGSSLLALASQ